MCSATRHSVLARPKRPPVRVDLPALSSRWRGQRGLQRRRAGLSSVARQRHLPDGRIMRVHPRMRPGVPYEAVALVSTQPQARFCRRDHSHAL
eukprot:7682476-Alexandrium_andersonii.AAC.1